jgi:hypothetical protein
MKHPFFSPTKLAPQPIPEICTVFTNGFAHSEKAALFFLGKILGKRRFPLYPTNRIECHSLSL